MGMKKPHLVRGGVGGGGEVYLSAGSSEEMTRCGVCAGKTGRWGFTAVTGFLVARKGDREVMVTQSMSPWMSMASWRALMRWEAFMVE